MILDCLSQINQELHVSLLLDLENDVVTVGVRLKGNPMLTHGTSLPNFS